MNRGLENQVKELKERAEAKKIVIEAARNAILVTALMHKLDKTTVKNAVEAVTHDVIEYVVKGQRERIDDLRNIAQDAAEGVFRKRKYDSPDMLGDFNKTLNKQLNLPEDGE